jgi:peptidoglycan/xylan/chitin deacetylase (PgdA/CDA1 family)
VKEAWPDGKKFALCLTHDVDRIKKSWWHSAYYLLKTGNLHHLKTLFVKHGEPYWNIEKIMSIEEKLDVRSTFFFLHETKKLCAFKPSTYELALGNYDVNERRVVEAIKKLEKGGWEIGVHGSYDSYNNILLLGKEKRQLEGIVGKPIIGIRQHYLNLKIPETWEFQRGVGFKYDSSFGSNREIGFREGKTSPFRPFNDEFLEIPLAIMDVPLFECSSDLEHAWLKCKEQIGYAENSAGLLTLLWHSNRFDDDEYPGQGRVYERIIEECKKREAWVATAEQVWSWFVGDLKSTSH